MPCPDGIALPADETGLRGHERRDCSGTAAPKNRDGCRFGQVEKGYGRFPERFLLCWYRNQNLGSMYFLWYLLIGLVAGWLANLFVKGHGSGLVVNLIVGIIGGILGGWVLSLFGLVAVGTAGSLIASVAGAVILLWIARAVTAPAKKKPAR